MASYSLPDMHRHFRVPAASNIRVMEAAGSLRQFYISTGLQWLDQGHKATSLSPPWEPQISFYMTLNKSLKTWPKC